MAAMHHGPDSFQEEPWDYQGARASYQSFKPLKRNELKNSVFAEWSAAFSVCILVYRFSFSKNIGSKQSFENGALVHEKVYHELYDKDKLDSLFRKLTGTDRLQIPLLHNLPVLVCRDVVAVDTIDQGNPILPPPRLLWYGIGEEYDLEFVCRLNADTSSPGETLETETDNVLAELNMDDEWEMDWMNIDGISYSYRSYARRIWLVPSCSIKPNSSIESTSHLPVDLRNTTYTIREDMWLVRIPIKKK